MAHQIIRISERLEAQGCISTDDQTSGDDGGKTFVNKRVCAVLHNDSLKAGDGIRTHDVQLGKLAFYH